MLISDFLSKTGHQNQIEVALYTPEPQPMPVAGPALGQAAIEMLASRGIKYHPLHRLVSVDPHSGQMMFDGKGSVSFDLLVAIPPHRSPAVVAQSALAGETGWITVDRASLRTRVDNVYAVGDVTSIPIPGRWKPEVALSLPKAGVFAHSQALVAARRIAGEIKGQQVTDAFCGDGYCMLEAGEDLAGFAFGNFFAEPSPDVRLKRIGRSWHWGKVLFEKMWLSPPGLRKWLYASSIEVGAKMLKVPTSMS
jgi:sulfide:quinone oxidoreductase